MGGSSAGQLIASLIDLYTLVVIVAVVVSWLNLPGGHPALRILHGLTDPLLDPIRRVLPDFGGIDLSPVVLIIALQFLKSLLL